MGLALTIGYLEFCPAILKIINGIEFMDPIYKMKFKNDSNYLL